MSAIDWLGKINPSWGYAPLFTLGSPKKTPNNRLVEKNLLSLSYGRIVRKNIESSEGLVPASYETYQIVEPGDTILRFTDLQNDQRSLRSGLVTERGIITSAYLSFTPNKDRIYPEFFAYMMRALDTNKVFYRMGSGVRQSLNWSEFSLMRLPLPPMDEQQRIADYLDRETAEIDAAVSDLERYVELLEKRRSVLITEVVNGRMMSEWGTVPAGLVMNRYREIAGVRSSEYKRLSLTLGGVVPRKRDDAEGLQPTNFEGYQVLPEGSLVFKLIDLENVSTSRVGLSTETGIVSPAYIVVQPHNDRLFAKFGYYAFWDLYKRNYFNSMGNDGVRSALNYSDLARIRIPFPSLDEQKRIADYLDTETARIDSLIAESTKLRELLIQRRSVLITEVVTGKRQV